MAKPAGELAVVDRAPAEGGFGKAGLAAIVGDFLQQFLRVHGALSLGFPRGPAQRRFAPLLHAARDLMKCDQFRG